jgi:membrane protein DedA with SNARE-associated domain
MSPDWNSWLQQAGYVALYIGTALEGETVLLLAVWFMQKGLFEPLPLFFTAALGAFSGDQLFFRVGLYRGTALLDRKPHWAPKVEKIKRHLHRHRHWLMAGYRLVPGTRILVPLILGTAKTSKWEFAVLNLAGCLLWSGLVVSFGLAFVEAWQRLDIRLWHQEWIAFGVVFIVFFGTSLWNLIDFRHLRRHTKGVM